MRIKITCLSTGEVSTYPATEANLKAVEVIDRRHFKVELV